MFNDITSVTLQSAMNGLALRQKVIADNIANVNTPHFLAGRVQFENALTAAVSSGSGMATANVARSIEPTRRDGNNVNLDRETLSNIDTGLRFSLMARAIDDRFGILRSSMRSS